MRLAPRQHQRRFLALCSRRWSSTEASAAPPRVCIVGSGPSGFYTAKYLLKKDIADVSILDRLPTPYGLVRFGVAPDHQPTKNVMSDFSSTLEHPRCRFYGNIEVGSDVSVEQLMSAYDAVVLAYGAESDRPLGIPGENLKGVHSARELVNWYNGHPDHVDGPFPDLVQSAKECVIIGHGNVAIDCARVLLSKTKALASSDICEHALSALRSSSINHVSLVGRRGPAQMAFTIKELREVTRLDGTTCHVHSQEIDKGSNEASLEEISKSRPLKKKFDFIKGFEDPPPSETVGDSDDSPRRLSVRFFLSPLRVEGEEGRVSGVECAVTALEGPPGRQKAKDTGERVVLPAQLLLTSVGYLSRGMEGVPFDSKRAVVPSKGGRVLTDDSAASVIPGLYVAGWLKRGPTGIIGTNIPDAKETVNAICEDLERLSGVSAKESPLDLQAVASDTGKALVDTEGWRRIEAIEDDEGKAKGKPREKIVDWQALIKAATSS